MYQDYYCTNSAPCTPCAPYALCEDYCNMQRKCSTESRVPNYYQVPYQQPSQRRGSKTPSKSSSKTRSSMSSKTGKVKSNNSFSCLCDTKKSEPSARNSKQMKNSQNYQCQDLTGKKKQMEVINEEKEPASEEEPPRLDSSRSKKIQDSCADFLSIVHDNVIDTVQKSVESILRDYFVHTMEKVECLCSQMMRNECLLSKMYLDVMDKISQQNEKSLRQFKCLCQFLTETRSESRRGTGSDADNQEEPMCCPCPKRQSRNVHNSLHDGMRNSYSRLSSKTGSMDECMHSCFARKSSLNGSSESHRQGFNVSDDKYASPTNSQMRMPRSQYMRVSQDGKLIDIEQNGSSLSPDSLRDMRYMRNDVRNNIQQNDNSILSGRTSDTNSSSDRRHNSSLKMGPSVANFNRKVA